MRIAFRQRYLCNDCRQMLHWDSQVDHIVPWCLSADDSEGNVQLLCPNCHANKSGDEMRRIVAARRILTRVSNAGMARGEALCWTCFDIVSPYFHTHVCAKHAPSSTDYQTPDGDGRCGLSLRQHEPSAAEVRQARPG